MQRVDRTFDATQRGGRAGAGCGKEGVCGWANCAGNRLDPCGCRYGGYNEVVCSADGRHIREIYLQGNGMEGELPPDTGRLTHLVALDLDSNNLTGTVPSELAALRNLTALDLDNNALHGALPPALAALRRLEGFQVNNNRLTGSVPGLRYASINTCTMYGNAFDVEDSDPAARYCGAHFRGPVA